MKKPTDRSARDLERLGHIARSQHVLDDDVNYVEPPNLLAEPHDGYKTLATRLHETHALRDEHHDIASASGIEVWINETERRTWFLLEASWTGDSSG